MRAPTPTLVLSDKRLPSVLALYAKSFRVSSDPWLMSVVKFVFHIWTAVQALYMEVQHCSGIILDSLDKCPESFDPGGCPSRTKVLDAASFV
jgi:hypothetical protein